VITKTKRGDFR